MKEDTEAQTIVERSFCEGVRSNASYLRCNFGDLTEKEAEVIARKLEECAQFIETLLTRQELIDCNPSPAVCHAMARFWEKMAERVKPVIDGEKL